MVAVQNLATALAFGLLAGVLHGCGGSGDETTTPAAVTTAATTGTTTTATATTTTAATTGTTATATATTTTAATTGTTTTTTPTPQPAALDDNMMITLGWTYRPLFSPGDTTWQFELNVDFANYTPGFVAIGFSTDGKMGNGTYIMGYSDSASSDGCVRTLANNEGESIPFATGKISIVADHTWMVVDGSKVTMKACVTLHALELFGVHNVMYAASSADAAVPETCNAALTASMHHNLGSKGYVGHKAINFGARPDALQTQVTV